jgi:hypothetical protein
MPPFVGGSPGPYPLGFNANGFFLKFLHINDFRAFLIMCIVGMPLIVGICSLFSLLFEKPFLTK